MHNIKLISLLGALVSISSLSFATDIVNPSFETGDLTGWTVSGGTAYATQNYSGGYTAPWEDFFAVAIAGCSTTTLAQTFSAKEGDTLLGWSFFNANDYLPFNDTGIVKVVMESDSSQTLLFSSTVAQVGSYGQTPWVPWEFIAPEDGDYSFKVLSTNYIDCGFDSAVGIDLAESGGFVTGGGWINSQAGAYMAEPELTGKANFGFVSKYKKGANKPTGNTEFQFQTGDINFHSSDYDWLVVNKNSTNAQFKGIGTVNGAGNFGFMLWATDYSNSPDTFRIKIWDIDNGDSVVYDNGVGEPLGGGNIVIRNK